jgi:hypothetical protein
MTRWRRFKLAHPEVAADLAGAATGAPRTVDGLSHTVLLLVLDVYDAVQLLFVRHFFVAKRVPILAVSWQYIVMPFLVSGR